MKSTARTKFSRLGLIILAVLLVSSTAVTPYTVSASGVQPARWATTTIPEPSDYASGGPSRISCISANFCQAVGSYTTIGNYPLPYIASYDGTNWSKVDSPNPADSDYAILNDISCVSTTFCQAVGWYNDPINYTQPGLIYTYDGTSWTASRSPQPAGDQYITLNRIVCVSTTFCQAVGSSQDRTVTDFHPLIVTYDGTSWSMATSAPEPVDSTSASFTGVDCIQATFCQAVGSYRDTSNASRTLAQVYNGTSWSDVTSIDPLSDMTSVYIGEVRCVSTSLCQAIGMYYPAGSPYSQSITRSYNGSAWSETTIIGAGSYKTSNLIALDCVSSTSCQAVGDYTDSGNVMHPLLHTYNGTNWNVTPITEPSGATSGRLDAVSCATATSCQAVGLYQDAGNLYHGFGLSYDGDKWSRIDGLEPANFKYTNTRAISCASPTSCQAIGQYATLDGNYHILLGTYVPAGTTTSSIGTTSPTSTGHGILAGQSNIPKLLSSQNSAGEGAVAVATSQVSRTTQDTPSPTNDSDAPSNKAQRKNKDTASSDWWWVVIIAGVTIVLVAGVGTLRRNNTKN